MFSECSLFSSSTETQASCWLGLGQVMSGLTSSHQVLGQVGVGPQAVWAQEGAGNLHLQQQQQTLVAATT